MPLVQFFSMTRNVGLIKAAIVCGPAVMFPSFRPAVSYMVWYYFTAMALFRDLCDVGVDRLRPGERNFKLAITKNNSLVMGFVLPIFLINSIPILGPLAFLYCFSASAALFVRVVSSLEKTEAKDDVVDESKILGQLTQKILKYFGLAQSQ